MNRLEQRIWVNRPSQRLHPARTSGWWKHDARGAVQPELVEHAHVVLVEHLDRAHVVEWDGHVPALVGELPQVGAELDPGRWWDRRYLQSAEGIFPQHLVRRVECLGCLWAKTPGRCEQRCEVLTARHAGNRHGG